MGDGIGVGVGMVLVEKMICVFCVFNFDVVYYYKKNLVYVLIFL